MTMVTGWLIFARQPSVQRTIKSQSFHKVVDMSISNLINSYPLLMLTMAVNIMN